MIPPFRVASKGPIDYTISSDDDFELPEVNLKSKRLSYSDDSDMEDTEAVIVEHVIAKSIEVTNEM